MRMGQVAAENNEDNLFDEKSGFWVFKVQWVHFIGEVEKNWSYLRQISWNIVYHKLSRSVHFGLSYSRKHTVAFFLDMM